MAILVAFTSLVSASGCSGSTAASGSCTLKSATGGLINSSNAASDGSWSCADGHTYDVACACTQSGTSCTCKRDGVQTSAPTGICACGPGTAQGNECAQDLASACGFPF